MIPHAQIPTPDTTPDEPELNLDDRCWGKWVDGRQYTLEVIQEPVRARMCGFGDKDRRPVAPAVVAELVVRELDNSIVSHDAIDCTFFIAAVDLWSDNGLTNMNMVLSPATSDKPHRGTPRKRQHSGTITTDTIMSHSSPTDPETPRAVPRNLPWSYTGRNLAPESETSTVTGILSPPLPVSGDRTYSYQPPQPSSRSPPSLSAPLHDPMTFNPHNPYGPPAPPPSEPVQAWPYSPPPGPPPPQAALVQHTRPPYSMPPPQQQAALPSAQASYSQQLHFPQQGHVVQPVPLAPESYTRGPVSVGSVDGTAPGGQLASWEAITVDPPAPTSRPDSYYLGVWDAYAPIESNPSTSQQSISSGSSPPGTYDRDYRSHMWNQASTPEPAAHANRYTQSGFSAPLATASQSAVPQVIAVPPPTNAPAQYIQQQHGLQPQIPTHGLDPHAQHGYTSAMPQQRPVELPQAPSHGVPIPPPPASQGYHYVPPKPAYVRTLVGPLVSNAYRLVDENQRLGIFFLFQDLSVRTEGSFRLRVRLMNLGVPPAPASGSMYTHTGCSPILAQTFTEPFLVYSAKRFPGVPENTPLSTAFAKQGQKLPLRSKNGEAKGRKRRRGADSGSAGGEDSDG